MKNTCEHKGCSRPADHRGGCGMITERELRTAVPGSNGSRPDRLLWHAINQK